MASISGVSSGSSASAGSESTLASLEKQVAAVKKKMQEEIQSEDDAKTKEKKVQMYNLQLQMLEQRIAELKKKQSKEGSGVSQESGQAANSATLSNLAAGTQVSGTEGVDVVV